MKVLFSSFANNSADIRTKSRLTVEGWPEPHPEPPTQDGTNACSPPPADLLRYAASGHACEGTSDVSKAFCASVGNTAATRMPPSLLELHGLTYIDDALVVGSAIKTYNMGQRFDVLRCGVPQIQVETKLTKAEFDDAAAP